MAKSENGRAKARAKPNIPTVGATQSPLVAASTSSRPIIGAVQEKLTRQRVKAIRAMERSPVVVEAFVSTALPHDEGSCNSNHPKKLKAKTTSRRKKKILNGALVANSLRRCGPRSAVTMSARAM